MEGLRFRIVTRVDQVQEVIREIMGMVKGSTTMGDSETTQVLLSKGLNKLTIGTPTLGMQYGVITAMRKVTLLQHVLNRELGVVSFTSRHC